MSLSVYYVTIAKKSNQSEQLDKMKKLSLRFSAWAIALVVVLLGARLGVLAQSNGLGITPKQSFTMKAGEQASNSLYINNLNRNLPLNVHIQVVDFEPADESGAAKLLQATDQPQTPWSLKPYLSLPDNVTVPAGQSKSIPFTIKLPASIGAGTYYSAVEYIASTGNTQQQVNIAASTATLLFINVPGQVTELMTMQDFGMVPMKLTHTKTGEAVYSSDPKAKIKSIFTDRHFEFAYRVKNGGNVAEQPAGSLLIKNIFGHTVAHVDNANPKAQLALIGQTRRFQGCNPKSLSTNDLPNDTNCIAFNLKPGFYTATLAIYYGQNGQETRQIGATAHFWYLPWTSVIVFLVILALIIYAIYRLYHKTSRRR